MLFSTSWECCDMDTEEKRGFSPSTAGRWRFQAKDFYADILGDSLGDGLLGDRLERGGHDDRGGLFGAAADLARGLAGAAGVLGPARSFGDGVVLARRRRR